MNRHTDSQFGEDGHAADDALLLFVESELGERETIKLRNHLETCWSCRARAEKVQAAISAFVDYRDAVLTPLVAAPPDDVQRFNHKLNRVAARGTEKMSLLARVRASFGSNIFDFSHVFRQRLLIGTTAALIIIGLFFSAVRLDIVTTVSASEALEKVDQAQNEQLRRVEQPIIYQQIQVRRQTSDSSGEKLLKIESWRETTSNRFRRTLSDETARSTTVANDKSTLPNNSDNSAAAKLAEFEQILRDNQMNSQELLSAAAFRRWSESLPEKREEIIARETPQHLDALDLRVWRTNEASENEIVESSLLIRTRDWHPVEQQIKVRRNEGFENYRLIETAYEVIPLKSFPAGVFEQSIPTSIIAQKIEPKIERSPQVKPLAASSPRATEERLPSAQELASAEIKVRAALHSVNADLGEPIEIVPSKNAIEVRGLAETIERQAELLAALRDVPHVIFNVQTIEEAERAAASFGKSKNQTVVSSSSASPAESNDEIGAKVRTAPNPIREQLAQYFGANNSGQNVDLKIARLSSDAALRARSLLAEAWALRRIIDRYPTDEIARLQPADRKQLFALVRGHIERMRDQTREMQSLVGPPLAAVAAQTEDSGGKQSILGTDLSSASRAVFAETDQVSRLTRNLFASGTLTGQREARRAAAELLASLPQLENNLQQLEKLLANQ